MNTQPRRQLSLLHAGHDAASAKIAFDEVVKLAGGSRAARQFVADQLCGWLRVVWGPGRAAGPRPPALEQLAIEVLAFMVARLQDPHGEGTFCGLDLDLSGTHLYAADFAHARLSGGTVSLRNCTFGPDTSFSQAEFGGARVLFDGSLFIGSSHQGNAQFVGSSFRGSEVSFNGASFRGGISCFDDTKFCSGAVNFSGIEIVDSVLSFMRARFIGASVVFTRAIFASGSLRFVDCDVNGSDLVFHHSNVRVPASFDGLIIKKGTLSFDGSEISSHRMSLSNVQLLGGSVTMRNLRILGGEILFDGLAVDGGSLVMDGAQVLFGRLDMSAVSFLSGSVSFGGMEVKFDGTVELPWARYVSGNTIVRDDAFHSQEDHEFLVRTAVYKIGVLRDWGQFAP